MNQTSSALVQGLPGDPPEVIVVLGHAASACLQPSRRWVHGQSADPAVDARNAQHCRSWSSAVQHDNAYAATQRQVRRCPRSGRHGDFVITQADVGVSDATLRWASRIGGCVYVIWGGKSIWRVTWGVGDLQRFQWATLRWHGPEHGGRALAAQRQCRSDDCGMQSSGWHLGDATQ
ncbi:hypothetical protein FUT69_11005 [Xylella taiwanensis]|uniref:Uncharacterized protein n=1 Tax=Xylella taiwanensis TaxID=1444770 RepID=A0ABS8TU86_9GAMM|nr:hypothetical protein [Xylella taiwanensis]MCD8461894.1 hypothetical protein [Xylella taiwanensis]MCD8462075.1 hypothetical protein [Xylella taiwanensis]MCD8465857.1 hypothetical protein [Xylella taiwanensis]MCD8468819.1 hypothetical protein [Xylella taiwanensis]MCD8468840.1 hypothetical protein [Xylella taiwanensis]